MKNKYRTWCTTIVGSIIVTLNGMDSNSRTPLLQEGAPDQAMPAVPLAASHALSNKKLPSIKPVQLEQKNNDQVPPKRPMLHDPAQIAVQQEHFNRFVQQHISNPTISNLLIESGAEFFALARKDNWSTKRINREIANLCLEVRRVVIYQYIAAGHAQKPVELSA